MQQLIHKFRTLFKGLDRAHGTYNIPKEAQPDSNQKLTGKAVTLIEPVTDLLWSEHLSGAKGLGIVPIRDDSTCFFGAIDVDVYPLDYAPTLDLVRKNELPLVPCRTKSGGLHLYTFLSEPTPAKIVRQKLAHYAAFLGFAGSEIYPRQDEVLSDRGDMGQWINIPYFDKDKTTRYAMTLDGEGMPADVFANFALAKRMTAAQFAAFTVDILPDLSDGPPCLQHLLTRKGFVSGTRNDGMYNICIYLKRKSEKWEGLAEEINRAFFDPPLLASEMVSVIKSIRKKDYDYSCGKSPLKGYCDSGTCRTRKFGVGALLDFPTLTALTKYNAVPPIWFVDVEGGGRLELSTEDLQQQARFQRVCMDSLNVMPPNIRPATWYGLIKALMEKVNIVEMPSETNPTGQVLAHLETFCTALAPARTREEIVVGKPWTEVGRTFFLYSHFQMYLERKKFKDVKSNKIASILHDVGATTKQMKIRGKAFSVWSVPAFAKLESDVSPVIEESDVNF